MRYGVDPKTGNWLEGWDHCVSCLAQLLTTRIGSVPWRRLYGAAVKDLQDQNATPQVIIDFYSAIAVAVDRYEPGFRLETIEMIKAGRDGVFKFILSGQFFPRGHLGDYSIVEDQSTSFASAIFTAGMLEAA